MPPKGGVKRKSNLKHIILGTVETVKRLKKNSDEEVRFSSSLIKGLSEYVDHLHEVFIRDYPLDNVLASQHLIKIAKNSLVWLLRHCNSKSLVTERYSIVKARQLLILLTCLSQSSDKLTSSFFCDEEFTHFQDFLKDYWEVRPLIGKSCNNGELRLDKACAMLREKLGLQRMISTKKFKTIQKLMNFLKSCVACPPAASNSTNIVETVFSMGEGMGGCLIYGQDFTLVKTFFKYPGTLLHYSGYSNGQKLENESFIKAFEAGYTIALRALQFRHPEFCKISRNLSSIFGQASTGANLYITPPGSQGLCCHYDDRCVFVCQLSGTKEWTLFPPLPNATLPRLYEPRESPSPVYLERAEKIEFTLKPGDFLYLPRGWYHEARTSESTFSVHVTFGVEVEPCFELSGFLHLSVNLWLAKKASSEKTDTNDYWKILSLSALFLHLHIEIKSKEIIDLRRACLISITSPQTKEKVKNLLQHLINTADSKSLLIATATWIVEGKMGGNFWWEEWKSTSGIEGVSDVREILLSHGPRVVETSLGEYLAPLMEDIEGEVATEGKFLENLNRIQELRSQLAQGLVSLHLLTEER